jgi:hypothetical protein
MISQEFVEKVALFYQFAVLDQARARALTEFTLKKMRQEQLAAKVSRRELSPVDLIRLTSDVLKKSKSEVRPTHLAFSNIELVLPPNSDFGPWFEFRKISDDAEFVALLYSKIMKMSDEQISEGLGLPVGTVRFRVGKGMRTLGRIRQMGGREGES